MGATVNQTGCWVLGNVLFDINTDVIKSELFSKLDNIAAILEKNPGMNIKLHGHCDNIGAAKYNMNLSVKRANAVKNYLIEKGILKDRLEAQGFGFTKPVASNNTEEGRALNRRIEINPY